MTAEGRASCQDHHWKTCPAWQCWLCMISSSMTTSAPGRPGRLHVRKCVYTCIVRVAYGVAPGAACTLLAQLMHDWIRFTWRGLCTIPIPSELESSKILASKPAHERELHTYLDLRVLCAASGRLGRLGVLLRCRSRRSCATTAQGCVFARAPGLASGHAHLSQ